METELVSKLNDMPLWHLQCVCDKHNLGIVVKYGRIVGIIGCSKW